MNIRTLLSWLLLVTLDTALLIVSKIAGTPLDAKKGLAAVLAQGVRSPWVVGSFSINLALFVVWMTILKDSDLSRAFPMTAINSVAAVAAAALLFHEPLTAVKILGVAAIVTGVFLLARDSRRAST
jgi:drug/metabolite transporter (DMT)-like permease